MESKGAFVFMETQKGIIEFSFITRESPLYSKAVELRYKIFFAPLNISMDAVFDNMEEQSIHLVAHIGDTTLGYARLTIENNLGQIIPLPIVKTRFLKFKLSPFLI